MPILDAEIVDEDDEEAWLEALEAGELNEHGELKKEKDVNLLTTRQVIQNGLCIFFCLWKVTPDS